MSAESKPSTSSATADREFSHTRKTVKSYGISIDSSKIHEVAYDQQPESLRDLGVNIFDQDVFEEGVFQQVDEAIAKQEHALEKQRLEKELKAVEEQLRINENKISRNGRNQQTNKILVIDDEELEQKRDHLLQKLGINKESQGGTEFIHEETNTNNVNAEKDTSGEQSAEKLLHIGSHKETEVERLIRLGEMTPFGTAVNRNTQMAIDDLGKPSSGAKENNTPEEEPGNKMGGVSSGSECDIGAKGADSTRLGAFSSKAGQRSSFQGRTENVLVGDKDDGDEDTMYVNDSDGDGAAVFDDEDGNFMYELGDEKIPANISSLDSDEDYVPDEEDLKLSWDDDQFVADEDSIFIPEEDLEIIDKVKKSKKHKSKPVKKSTRLHRTTKDDGDDRLYQIRIREAKLKKVLREKGIDYSGKSDEEDEDDSWNEGALDEEFEGGLKIPGVIWNRLFRYQQTGVKWLWELHCQQAGGIVGDEMGLGKTIQVIAFLAGLKYSNLGRRTAKQSGLGPVLIICPATVLYQWVAEFHKWWPEFRVAVLHDTGSYQGPKDKLINKIRNTPGILITTYSGVRLNQEQLLPAKWDYVILDEGHTIRNPDAEITLACKQFRTTHRIILSGSPMQNNLRELWSLFDFVFPGKLGTLPVFMQEFSVPITMGGYANATPVQVQTAYKCACVLRDTINPYLLRRLKKDVKMKLDLPNKNEQVLFCRLTEEQTEIYKEYLASREVGSILSGTMKVFPGLIMLRKICNHPDLTTEAGSLWKLRKDQDKAATGQGEEDEIDSEYGYWKRSGKLIVVHSLLKLWKKQKHKVLLFTQTRQMLKILEIFVKSQGYSYLRMDGSTSISSRQPLIEKFNKDESIFVFLLTTRVGGLGVNLVGANRVIIYDPDWNPGTDIQARERAWRVGQKKDVTIYRLLTTGTIEEKIYHRQIFKQFLTNRVLKDPKQRRFFKSNDLFELFTLDTSDNTKSGTETGAIFAGLGCEVKVAPSQRRGSKRKIPEPVDQESVLKRIKERTKEILRSRFSSPNESTTQLSKNGSDPNEVATVKNCLEIDETPNVAPDSSGDGREPPDSIRGATNDSAIVFTCNDSMTQDDGGCKNNNSNSVPSGQSLSVNNTRASSVEIGETRSNWEAGGIDCAQISSEPFSAGKDSSVISKEVTAGTVRDEEKHGNISPSPDKDEVERKSRKSKKKKKKRNKIEGIRIGQLSYSEPYVSKKDSVDGGSKRGDDDHYILRKLFKKSGVHSALQHDTIVNSGNSDHILVENEAKRVAAQAAEALQRSREHCMQHRRSGLPTWTGQSGFVGSPNGIPTKAMFGPSTKTKTVSKEDTTSHFSGESLLEANTDAEAKTTSDPISSTQLLARMRARNFLGGNNAGSEVPSNEQKYEQTMKEVREFIATRCSLPGRATTREILEEFSSRLPVSDSAIFRAMLKTICDFDRDASGVGFWVLKPQFFNLN